MNRLAEIIVICVALTLFSFLWLGFLSLIIDLIIEGFKFFYGIAKSKAPQESESGK